MKTGHLGFRGPYSAMMNRGSMDKFSIPNQLREVLLDFTINYLLEQPPDLLQFGVEFFTRLRDSRTQIKIDGSPEESLVSGDEEGQCVLTDKITVAKSQ